MAITHDPKIAHEWELIGDLMVTRTVAGQVPNDIWDAFIDALSIAPITKVFALALGAATINTAQRQAAANVFREKRLVATVVSDDRMTRGVITAMSWLGASLKPFAWADLDAAIANLNVDATTATAARRIAKRCQGGRLVQAKQA